MRQRFDEIRRRGLAALRKELGRAGMIRFLGQFERGSGDYAKERREWVDRVSMSELRKAAGRLAKKRTRKRP